MEPTSYQKFEFNGNCLQMDTKSCWRGTHSVTYGADRDLLNQRQTIMKPYKVLGRRVHLQSEPHPHITQGSKFSTRYKGARRVDNFLCSG